MSGFGGHMTVYRQISIDRFDKKNLKSTVFLLSHCHRDHMIGLNQPNFLRCLKSRNDIFLYCSEVTKLLLLSEEAFKPLTPHVRVLEIGVATTVTIPDPESDEFKSVVITTLPAGHCPGSVMFLIEGKEGRALYTGDFRWEKNYATTLPALCVNGHMKEIDSMYVDTTFCLPEAFCIPSRDDCLSATASLVVAWLRHSPRRYVHVSSRTKYGHEPLLSHLAKEADTKVHTSKEKVEIYEQITELHDVFTADPSARIHACNWQMNHSGESRLPCGYCPPKESSKDDSKEAPEVLVIRPSTMWFTSEPSRLQELVVLPASRSGLHRVCYSFHSSYSELRDLVSLLKPRRVYPNVLPASDTDWAQVGGRLEKFLTYQHKHHMMPAGDSDTVRPLGLLKRKRKESDHNLTDSEGLVFDSPEKPKRARQESSKDEDILPSSQKSGASIISPVKSDAHSSYQGSDLEEDMFAHSDEEDITPVTPNREGRDDRPQESESLRSYVSGDEEVPEEDQVSSLQFRRLTSRDDLPDDRDPQLCLDDEELGKSPLLGHADVLYEKQLNPEAASDHDLVCPPNKIAKLSDVKKSSADSKEILARIFGKQVGQAALKSPESTDNKEERRGSIGRSSTTSTDCSVHQKASSSNQITSMDCSAQQKASPSNQITSMDCSAQQKASPSNQTTITDCNVQQKVSPSKQTNKSE